MKSFLCVALSCVLVSLVQADDAKTKMTIAFVEGNPDITGATTIEKIKTNLDEYVKDIETKSKTVDIVVLPEYGLTGRSVDKNLAITLSNVSSNDAIKYLNDKARAKKWVLVANILENDDDDLYSTTVVLDGTDKFLAKYRKINVNKASEENLKSSDETVTFNHTIFGTIGLLSGEDGLYEEQIRNLKDQSVTTIIYTTSMQTVAPFGVATSLHAGLAKALGINVVVASLSEPQNHTSGSGVYTPCSSQAYVSAKVGPFVGIATIDIKQTGKCGNSVDQILRTGLRGVHADVATISTLPAYDYDGLVTEILNTNLSTQEKCDGSFCCNFTWTNPDFKKEIYRLAVKGGDQKICALMKCAKGGDEEINTCGVITDKATAQTTFESITIETSDGSSSIFMPYILHSDLTQISDDIKALQLEATNDKTTITTGKVSNTIAIGIVAAKSGASSLQILATNVIVLSVILKFLF